VRGSFPVAIASAAIAWQSERQWPRSDSREVCGVGEQNGPLALDPFMEVHVAHRGLRREVGHDVSEAQHLQGSTAQHSHKTQYWMACIRCSGRLGQLTDG